MFNLEHSIAEWRKQMLAVGIKSPVPLEELESHLREEIERRMMSGANETAAFREAIREIGYPNVLRHEFNKAEANDPVETVINSLIQIIGWVGAACVLTLGFGMLEIDWDLWGFKLTWDPYAFWGICQIFLAEAGILFLATVNRDRTSRIVSLFICLLLGVCAIFSYHHQVYPRGILGGLLVPNPFWYRWSTTLLFLLPGVFWISRRRPSRRDQQQVITSATIVAERIFSVIAASYIIFISIRFLQTRDGAAHVFLLPAVLLAILLAACGYLTFRRTLTTRSGKPFAQ